MGYTASSPAAAPAWPGKVGLTLLPPHNDAAGVGIRLYRFTATRPGQPSAPFTAQNPVHGSRSRAAR